MGERVRYARCSLDRQDLTAQRGILLSRDVPEDRIYLDHGLTGTNRDRPGPGSRSRARRRHPRRPHARPPRTLGTDARDIGDSLTAPGVKLSLGDTLYDPVDSRGEMFFNLLATFAEFEVGLLRMRTREGMAVARAKGKLKGRQPKLTARPQAHLVQQHQSGEHTIADLGELFCVSRATLYRVLERHRNVPAPATSGGQ